jgi:hypothetical protein
MLLQDVERGEIIGLFLRQVPRTQTNGTIILVCLDSGLLDSGLLDSELALE